MMGRGREFESWIHNEEDMSFRQIQDASLAASTQNIKIQQLSRFRATKQLPADHPPVKSNRRVKLASDF